MIKIQEIKPIKMSGVSSLWITFDFNIEVVNILKGLDCFYYHKAEQAWEIPTTSLSQILDSMTFLDDIQLITIPSPETSTEAEYGSVEAVLSEPEIQSFRVKPFNHQIEGINFLLTHPKALLLDSMGIGKSLEIMYLAETLKRRGLIEHCLIICGLASLRQNWKREISKFSNESCVVIGEKISKSGTISYTSVSERTKQLKDPISEFFVIINVESLRDDKIITAIAKSSNNFGMIAVDEIHKIATKSSQQGANLLKLKSTYKVGATGTLLTNTPISCYVPLNFTENDRATLTTFKSTYCVFGGFNNSQIIGYKNLDLLKDELEHCSIRRTFDMVKSDMPTKTIETELVEMSDEHKKFYEDVKNGIKEEADKVQLNSNNLLALTTRLRQATASPTILTTQEITSSKIERCVELVEELVEAGEKVVVFSVFKEPVYQLGKLLEKYKPLINTGDIADSIVAENVDKFQNDPNSKIFIGTHAKVGTGFSLPIAHYCIMLDTPWTYAQFSQSADRVYRITSQQNVFIKVLCCANTIDERVWEIVETKKDLADFVIDGKDNAVSESLKNEMLSIIRNL